MKRTVTLGVLAGVVLLAGCSHAPLQRGFGDSNEANIRIETVNPKAGKEDVPMATLDGQKSERLLKSYRTDSGKAASGSIIDIK